MKIKVDTDHVRFLLARRCMAYFALYADERYQMNWHHQLLCDYLDRFVSGEMRRLMVFMPPRHGKALAVDTPIPTPKGWTVIGDLRPGDKVFDEYGHPTDVLAISPVWKNRPAYRVKTDCGDEIIADAAHEWICRLDRHKGRVMHRRRVQTSFTGTDGYVYKKYETEYLANRTSQRAPLVQLAKGLELQPAALPIDPYVLGVWLGDGRSDSAAMVSVSIHAPTRGATKGLKMLIPYA